MQQSKARRAPAERVKRKRLRGVFRFALISTAIAGALLAAGLLDRNTGVGHWLDLRRDLAVARARIAELEARIAARELEARALREDPVALEAAIRRDLGVARPGEWVVREEGLTNLRNP